LYVAGQFGSAGGQPISHIAKWDGVTWSGLGTGLNGDVSALAVWNDGTGSKLYVSGTMTVAGGVPVSRIATWDGTSWSALRVSPSTATNSMLAFDDGSGSALYAGLSTIVNGVYTNNIARFDGTHWSALGGGVHGEAVYDMAAFDDGSGHGPDLYMVGRFFTVGGGIPSVHIARWIRCAGPIDSTCFGDLTVDACPCANTGHLGRGCENSAGTGGALMNTSGATRPDTLRLIISGELSNSLTILLQGSAPTLSTLTFGDGLRCTGGHLLRLYVTNASNGDVNLPGQGNPSISARSAALGDPLSPGSIRLYQVYYRDSVSTCGAYFNASNGARVVW
jgi:hypothetical protein